MDCFRAVWRMRGERNREGRMKVGEEMVMMIWEMVKGRSEW